jgi:hypothetical protein
MMNKLAEWLDKQGFSLEMRAAAAFRGAGFDVKQSAHYHDRGLGKDREVDVIATRRERSGRALVHVAVECKSSDKPWVVLISPDTLATISRWLTWGILSHEAIDTFASGDVVNEQDLPWYRTGDECGYSFRKAFTDRDDGFAAAAAVCSAAQYLVLPMQADRRELPPYAVAFPVIVVDKPIVECRINPEGSIEFREVLRSEFLFEDHLMFDAWPRIRVVHISELPTFATEAYGAVSEIHKILTDLPPPRGR